MFPFIYSIERKDELEDNANYFFDPGRVSVTQYYLGPLRGQFVRDLSYTSMNFFSLSSKFYASVTLVNGSLLSFTV